MKQLSELTWGEIEDTIKEAIQEWKNSDKEKGIKQLDVYIVNFFVHKYGWFRSHLINDMGFIVCQIYRMMRKFPDYFALYE